MYQNSIQNTVAIIQLLREAKEERPTNKTTTDSTTHTDINVLNKASIEELMSAYAMETLLVTKADLQRRTLLLDGTASNVKITWPNYLLTSHTISKRPAGKDYRKVNKIRSLKEKKDS